MNINNEELIAVLSSFNPWWKGENIAVPSWQRSAFHELFSSFYNQSPSRAILVSGARQVGKTTLLLQVIKALLENKVHPSNILYATFDHPLLKLAGIERVLTAWRERELKQPGEEYLFLDEAQFMRDCGTWIKHQVDFNKERRVLYTGSAIPLIKMDQESGVGRTHIIKLATLSFYEYLRLQEFWEEHQLAESIKELQNIFNKKNHLMKNENEYFKIISNLKPNSLYSSNSPKSLPEIKNLDDIFKLKAPDRYKAIEFNETLIGRFNEYLIRGGFPQTAKIQDISYVQRLLREDIIDKVLKRDMTALFAVRHVLDLEQLFLYLCMHDSGILDIPTLCKNLGLKRPTVQNFIELLEATHLIYRLLPFGYGKEILRGKYKIYLADAAIAPAVLLKGKEILNDSNKIGTLVETAVFKHIFSYYQGYTIRYWQNKEQKETDIIVDKGTEIIPIEIKYRQNITPSDLEGLLDFCNEKAVKRAIVVTKSFNDFGFLENTGLDTEIIKIPASLFCYWMGRMESKN